MLFHITATHTPEGCPAYSMDKMPEVLAAIENSETVAKDLGIKIHFLLSGAPEHVIFSLVEADSPATVARFMNSFPIRQDFKVTAVVPEQDLVKLAKQMMAAH